MFRGAGTTDSAGIAGALRRVPVEYRLYAAAVLLGALLLAAAALQALRAAHVPS